MIKVGIIGGSGLENIDGMVFDGETVLDTPFGAPSSPYRSYRLGNCLFYIISRHGDKHDIPPHAVNYRANIAGFKQLGAERIAAFSAVGGINPALNPGSLLLIDDAADFTSGRASSFYDSGSCVHIDLTHPFCPDLRNCIKKAALLKGVELTDGGTYVCTDGPRFETAAEIRIYASFGADVVGMTMFPEVSLAREAEICFASVNVVTNYAAGIEKGKAMTMDEVAENGAKASGSVLKIISGLSEVLAESRSCACKDALKGCMTHKK